MIATADLKILTHEYRIALPIPEVEGHTLDAKDR